MAEPDDDSQIMRYSYMGPALSTAIGCPPPVPVPGVWFYRDTPSTNLILTYTSNSLRLCYSNQKQSRVTHHLLPASLVSPRAVEIAVPRADADVQP